MAATSSSWAPVQHGVDVAGWNAPDAAVAPASPSSGGRKGFGWFKRDRSASPGNFSSKSKPNSRGASPNSHGSASRTPSPTFVVRNVVKRPGGVSLEADSSSIGHAAAAHYMSSSPTGSDAQHPHGSPSSQHASGVNLNYSRSKSRPLLSGVNLGVPPGGPGGGTGYGTAASSNDGRPEVDASRELWNGRGRSPSPVLHGGSHVEGQRQHSQRRKPSSPGATTAGAFRSGRVSPGPMSWSQAREQDEQERRRGGRTSTNIGSDHTAPAHAHADAPDPRGFGAQQQQQQQQLASHAASPLPMPTSSPQGPRSGPTYAGALGEEGGQRHAGWPQNHSPRTSSPLSSAPLPSTLSRDTSAPSRQQVQPATRDDRAPAKPLDGLPSPIDIPRRPFAEDSSSPHSPHSHGNRSHFGTPSPGASPLAGSPSPAGRWMKSFFGKSPREGAKGDADVEGMYGNQTHQWSSPAPPVEGAASRGPTPYGIQAASQRIGDSLPPQPSASRKPVPREERRDGSGQALPDDDDERRAELQKRHTQRAAARIIDEERRRLMEAPAAAGGEKPFSPRQVVDADDEDDGTSQGFLRRQTQSPPGRKPAPHSEEDTLGRLEGRLTPAQQIILETRSRLMAKEREDAAKAASAAPAARVQRGFDPNAATPSPRGPADGHQGSREARGAAPGQERSSKVCLQPGQGPLPADMPLPAALQEMMIRFYRYERYTVPLVRSLEARLLDIERDAQLAHNSADAMSASSAKDREMDKWVGQMTSLMKHEVGQLKAGAHEIREGRELLSQVIRAMGSVGMVGGGGGNTAASSRFTQSGGQRTTQGFGAAHADSPSSTKVETGQPLGAAAPASAKQGRDSEPASQDEQPRRAQPSHGHDAARATNVSSSSFRSAVPRSAPSAAAASGQGTSAVLELSEGAAPALEKDEGKSSHGRRRTSEASEGTAAKLPEGSSSPEVRPRFTAALGQPLRDGRISPASREMNRSEGSSGSVLEAPPPGRFEMNGAPASARASSSSPAPSDTSSAGRRRGLSIDDRLKALVDRTSSGRPRAEDASEGTASPTTERQALPPPQRSGRTGEKIGDDYVVVGAQVVGESDADGGAPEEPRQISSSPSPPPLPSKQYGQSPAVGHGHEPSASSEATAMPQPQRKATLTAPIPTATPLIGSRTSPTPSSHSAIASANAGRRSTSPAALVPTAPPSGATTIRTASHATEGLRARAQSYLQSAESTHAAGGTGGGTSVRSTSQGATPGPSPTLPASGSWRSNAAGAKPTSPTRSTASVVGRRSASPDKLAESTAAANSVVTGVRAKTSTASSLGGGDASVFKVRASDALLNPAVSPVLRNGGGDAAHSPSSPSPSSSSWAAGRKGAGPATLKERVAFFDSAN